MPIVEELRMEVPGPDNVWFISARRSARSFCSGCRMNATVLQDRALSQIACVWCRVNCEAKATFGILGFMAFSRSHTYGILAVAISKIKSSYFCRG